MSATPVNQDKQAWETGFIQPIARTMKQRGINYMLIILRDDGKASYVLDTEVTEATKALLAEQQAH